MGIGESAQVWEQMDMDAVTGDFERLFPSFSFDAQGVLADSFWRRLKSWETGCQAPSYFRGRNFGLFFLRFWFWVWRRRFLPILRTCSKTIRYRIWLSISYTFL